MQYKKFIVAALIGLSMCQWSLGSDLKKSENLGNKWLKNELIKRLTALKEVTKFNTLSVNQPTHFIFLSNTTPPAYAPDTFKKKLSTDPFVNSFMQSARKGSRLFWALLTEPKTITRAIKLSRVFELANFILFAALPTEIDKLTFDNLAINIHASPELITKLDEFFRSYKLSTESDTLFQISSHNPWYSIHFRTEATQPYRNLWLNKFKSFGFAMLADDLLEIRPHTDSQGRPSSYNNTDNILDITLDDLVSAYLMLNGDNKKASETTRGVASLMGAIFANRSTKGSTLNQKLLDQGQNYIQELQKTNTSSAKVLIAYLQSLLWEYTQVYAKKSSHNLAPINPSAEQIKASLSQYSLSPVSTADIKSFRESTQRGATLAKTLLVDDKTIKIDMPKEQEDAIKPYVQSIVDLNNLFYTLAIFSRDDGVGPATVTFQIAGNTKFREFIYGYLNSIEDYDFDLGTEKSMTGANPFAYYRKQSHHFKAAWGMEMRWFASDFNAKVTQEPQPYLFSARWQDSQTTSSVVGPQFHLLIGENPDNTDRLFFKWEEHGLYGGTVLAHAKDFTLSVARKQPFTRDLLGLTPDDAPQNNKERVPSIIAKTISKMVKDGNIPPKSKPELEKLAKEGIATLYNHCKKENINGLVGFLERTFDHPDIRWGNEIVIAPERDDSILWIDYFTTKNTKLKELYESFSLLKREIIAFATATVSTQEEGSVIEVEMPSFEKIKDMISDVMLKIEGNKETLNSKAKKYFDLISPILTKMDKLTEEDFTEFVRQYGRILFDTEFSTRVEGAFDDYNYIE